MAKKRIVVGCMVSFTLRAITEGENSDDVWDSILGKVDPNRKFRVRKRNNDGTYCLTGFTLSTKTVGSPPRRHAITVSPHALRRVKA